MLPGYNECVEEGNDSMLAQEMSAGERSTKQPHTYMTCVYSSSVLLLQEVHAFGV